MTANIKTYLEIIQITETYQTDGCKRTKSERQTNIYYQARNGCKRQIIRLQTFSLYIRYVRTLSYIETAANMIFEGCKGAKIGKTEKSRNKHDLTYHFAISEIANRCPYLLPTRKSEKKRKKSHIFCLNILPFHIKLVILQQIKQTRVSKARIILITF